MKKAVLALLAAACLFVVAVDARASAPGLTLDLEGVRAVWVQDEDREWYFYFPAAPDFVNERFIERWVIDESQAVVSRVVDGDTIDFTIGGETRRVRLLLVDTPEVYGGEECYGPEASAYVSSLLPEGAEVRLERDITDTDSFGRLLRYVYLADGRMLNELLLEGGYATIYESGDDERHEQRLRDVEERAREAGAGLWTACELADDADAEDSAAGDAGGEAAEGECDASYPDVCIPPPPPDLNCGDLEHRDIRVLPPDPHNLDADGDGVGCRSS